MTFSQQTGGADDASEKRRWQLINAFIASINNHRASRVSPSDLICVDKSMCKWYGQGGHWILRGMPMYVAIDRKPENGCEIQNAACGRSGIMLRLSVDTTADHLQEDVTGEEEDFPHGTAVLRKLVAPWTGTKRVVCADSNFASVTATQQLLSMGLRFIGVVKTGTKGFPMGALSVRPLEERVQRVSYVHTKADGVTDTMSVLWVDRERRYFISSASTNEPGTPYDLVRWRQVGDDAKRVVLTVAQPQVVETYYQCCAQIDSHNRCRQDDLQLEHKLITHDWSMRVNLSLLGMCVVDAWMLYSGAHGTAAELTQNQFYEDLAAELIDDALNTVGLRARGAPAVDSADRGVPPLRFGVGMHLNPTLKRLTGQSAHDGDQRAQRTCLGCKRGRTSYVCSGCRETKGIEVYFVVPRRVGHALTSTCLKCTIWTFRP